MYKKYRDVEIGRYVLYLEKDSNSTLLILEKTETELTVYSDSLEESIAVFIPAAMIVKVKSNILGFTAIAEIHIPYAAITRIQDFDSFNKENQDHLLYLV